jgi:hypothetical protein
MVFPTERVRLTLLPFLPLVSVAWALMMCIILISLFIFQDHYEVCRLQTLSFTAMRFQGDRVIAVGLGVMGIFIIFIFKRLAMRPILFSKAVDQ